MPDSPSAKRKRTEDPTVDDTLHLVRSAIWYDDGSIVIQAGSTQFRVHRSILCANSPVLKDMFPVDGELVEGCPILGLSDSAEDVAHLLKVLYDRRYYNSSDTQPVAVVAAILRLGRKYQIDYLHDDSVSRLNAMFPSTLNAAAMCWRNVITKLPYHYVIDTINLARETGILSILPFALLCVMSLDTKIILKGARRKDGTVAVLSPTNQEICLLGKDPIRLAQGDDMLGWMGLPSPGCLTPGRCDNYNYKDGWIICFWKSPSPIRVLGGWEKLREKVLCDPCARIGEKFYEDGRQRIWNKLPSFLGLPDWAELSP